MALDLGATFSTMYDGIVSTLSSRTGVLIGDGQDLASVLLFVVVSWSIVMWVLSGDGAQALVDSFGSLTKYFIVTILLSGWLGTVGGYLQGNVNDIAKRVAGTNSISQSVNLMVKSAEKLFARAPETCSEITTGDASGSGTTYNEVLCSTKETRGADVGFTDWLVMLPAVLFTLLLKMLAVVFMALMIAAYITVMFMAEILFGVALTLGPILVPWLIWQRTEWLFDGWLRFSLIASFTKIVAALMVAIVSSVIIGAKTLSEAIKVSNGMELIAVDEMAAFLMCVVAAIGAFLMWQTQGIAQGLLSGSGGATAQKFGQGSLGKGIGRAPAAAVGGMSKQVEAFSKALKGGSK
ncbi:MAG: type IV secretion system protein [Burkholderiaceae bacterium]|nr:type IV secretion system protein [Burkholderiaceae bacterium]